MRAKSEKNALFIDFIGYLEGPGYSYLIGGPYEPLDCILVLQERADSAPIGIPL